MGDRAAHVCIPCSSSLSEIRLFFRQAHTPTSDLLPPARRQRVPLQRGRGCSAFSMQTDPSLLITTQPRRACTSLHAAITLKQLLAAGPADVSLLLLAPPFTRSPALSWKQLLNMYESVPVAVSASSYCTPSTSPIASNSQAAGRAPNAPAKARSDNCCDELPTTEHSSVTGRSPLPPKLPRFPPNSPLAALLSSQSSD